VELAKHLLLEEGKEFVWGVESQYQQKVFGDHGQEILAEETPTLEVVDRNHCHTLPFDLHHCIPVDPQWEGSIVDDSFFFFSCVVSSKRFKNKMSVWEK
jgi:hypothetical protein